MNQGHLSILKGQNLAHRRRPLPRISGIKNHRNHQRAKAGCLKSERAGLEAILRRRGGGRRCGGLYRNEGPLVAPAILEMRAQPTAAINRPGTGGFGWPDHRWRFSGATLGWCRNQRAPRPPSVGAIALIQTATRSPSTARPAPCPSSNVTPARRARARRASGAPPTPLPHRRAGQVRPPR